MHLVQFLTHEDISKSTKSLLLNEIRTHNRQFPVGRFYTQLMTKQNQIEPTIKTPTDGNNLYVKQSIITLT